MQAQDMRSAEAETDATVLGWLIDSQAPWAVEEVARYVGDEATATDALGRLARAGLVHRLGGFVFPTRAGVRAAQLPLEA